MCASEHWKAARHRNYVAQHDDRIHRPVTLLPPPVSTKVGSVVV
jgi:hypothetical protein